MTARAPADPACSFCHQPPAPSTKLIRGKGDAAICGDCVLLCLGILTTPKGAPPFQIIRRRARAVCVCGHHWTLHENDGCGPCDAATHGPAPCSCQRFDDGKAVSP